MKRQIRSADSIVHMGASKRAKARKILDLATQLFDVLDDTPEDLVEEYSLQSLYDELNAVVYDMAHRIDK